MWGRLSILLYFIFNTNVAKGLEEVLPSSEHADVQKEQVVNLHVEAVLDNGSVIVNSAMRIEFPAGTDAVEVINPKIKRLKKDILQIITKKLSNKTYYKLVKEQSYAYNSNHNAFQLIYKDLELAISDYLKKNLKPQPVSTIFSFSE